MTPMTRPTLLPVSGSPSYTSSFSPSSPTSAQPTRPMTPTRSRRRSPLPSALLNILPDNNPSSSSSSYRVPHSIKFILTPRVLSPIILWSLALYLVHTYLMPLPMPSLSIVKSGITSGSGSKPVSEEFFLSTTIPPPPLREGDDSLDSVDPHYRPLAPLPAPDAPFPRLRPTRFLPPRCLEQWFADGETSCGAAELGEEERLDATWLWVNGSDPRWRDSMTAAREAAGVYSPEHHFREQNELVHSMRSVLDALPGKLRTFHLITADFPFRVPEDLPLIPEELIAKLDTHQWKPRYGKSSDSHTTEVARNNNNSARQVGMSDTLISHLANHWRVAQAPEWLDYSKREPTSPSNPIHPAVDTPGKESNQISSAARHHPQFRYATHTEIFHLPTYDRDGKTEALGEREWKEEQWRKQALPSFNSMAIESRVGWLPGLADVTLSLNDDFFLLRPHAVSDFHSPLYGSVIRFDPGYNQQVRPVLDKSRYNDAGEAGGLYHANYLLSQRFPRRLRPYFAHVPKVITRGLHQEASLMFNEALTTSSQRRFREMTFGEGDIQMQWLLTSLRVERWREALLWTFVVANLGTKSEKDPGQWGYDARQELKDMFGLTEQDDDVIKIEVHRGERWTLENGRVGKAFEQAGWESPKASEFLFSSMDGHMPPLLRPGINPNTNEKCLIDLDRCFGSFWSRGEQTPAADMFTRLTFQYPDCGNCMIMALVTASGPLGLSAFFPPKDRVYTNPPLARGKAYPKYLPPPHLPLTSTWHEADFALSSVLSTTALPNEEINLREYTMKLLSRYQYISAKSVHHFHMLKTPEHAVRVFKMIQDNPAISVLGLNDDIESGYEQVKTIMNEWFGMRWPRKAVWERGWDPIKDRLPGT